MFCYLAFFHTFQVAKKTKKHTNQTNQNHPNSSFPVSICKDGLDRDAVLISKKNSDIFERCHFAKGERENPKFLKEM